MAGICQDLQLRALDVLGQEAGGFDVRTVLFSAEDQGRTPDFMHASAEVQIFHRISQGKGIPFVNAHVR